MPMTCNPRASVIGCTRRSSGFNLIEAAIVLGVVGLVIGGIWIAAATVNENLKTSRAMTGMLQTVSNIQQLITIQNSDGLADWQNITSVLRDAGVFPRDWVSGSDVNSPYGYVTIENRQAPGRFNFIMGGIPQAACIKLISSISANSDTLTWVETNSNWGTSGIPVDMDTVNNQLCTQSSNLIVFVFNLTRAN